MSFLGRKKALFLIALFLFAIGPQALHAQTTVKLNAADLVPSAALSVSPAAESVIEGSTFNISVYLDTHRESANTISLDLSFPPDKLNIIGQSMGGQSFISTWVSPPIYSNADGTMHLAGIVPNGIVTQNGLIISLTFKAIASGDAAIQILPSSQVLANDGMGTPISTEYSNGTYTITPQPPAGVAVTSVTHPFED